MDRENARNATFLASYMYIKTASHECCYPSLTSFQYKNRPFSVLFIIYFSTLQYIFKHMCSVSLRRFSAYRRFVAPSIRDGLHLIADLLLRQFETVLTLSRICCSVSLRRSSLATTMLKFAFTSFISRRFLF